MSITFSIQGADVDYEARFGDPGKPGARLRGEGNAPASLQTTRGLARG